MGRGAGAGMEDEDEMRRALLMWDGDYLSDGEVFLDEYGGEEQVDFDRQHSPDHLGQHPQQQQQHGQHQGQQHRSHLKAVDSDGLGAGGGLEGPVAAAEEEVGGGQGSSRGLLQRGGGGRGGGGGGRGGGGRVGGGKEGGGEGTQVVAEVAAGESRLCT